MEVPSERERNLCVTSTSNKFIEDALKTSSHSVGFTITWVPHSFIDVVLGIFRLN